MMRFWFLDYYEDFDLPADGRFDRVRAWRAACLAHPAAQQVSREEIVKLYFDYALGAGNGALPVGRSVSSFVFEPGGRARGRPATSTRPGRRTGISASPDTGATCGQAVDMPTAWGVSDPPLHAQRLL